jgi:ABC-type transport system involved in cytochrome bd biosynthesis fused ATPase/permease subunit
MRFALAERFTEKASLSLMMDEVLVNFDPERAKGVADVVTGLAKKHQVLMFTCHLESVELMTKLITGQCIPGRGERETGWMQPMTANLGDRASDRPAWFLRQPDP